MAQIPVFLSSTFREFQETRQEVYGAYEKFFAFWKPESEGAMSGSNAERVGKAIDESLAFICLVGKQFGSEHPESQGESIVESELRVARERFEKYKKPEVFVYLPQELAGGELPEDMDARQKKFIESLTDYSKGTAYDAFQTSQELVAKVKERLMALAVDYAIAHKEMMDASTSSRRFLWAVSLLAVALQIVFGVIAVFAVGHARLALIAGIAGVAAAWAAVMYVYS